jgi:protein-tyrosine phosphatase
MNDYIFKEMPDCSLIKNGIFIGNAHSVIGNYATQESDLLDVFNIKVVISALTEDEYEDYMIAKEDFPDIEWHRFVVDDDEEERISEHFFKVHTIISEAIVDNKNVIVHCAAGMSRSPTLVIAYLMIENKWKYEEAIAYVKKCRPIVEPNIGFIKQLKSLEYKIRSYENFI